MTDPATLALITALIPTFSEIVKESSNIIRNQSFKLNAQNSAGGLSRIIIDLCTVKTMWSKDQGVIIENFYYPSKVLKKNYEKTEVSFNSLFNQRSIIEGIVGQGKSILLRHLCKASVECGMIPVFIELSTISKDRSLEVLILNFLDAARIDGGDYIFSYLAACGRLVLILDGFDEIPTSCISKTIYEIENYRKKYEKLGVVISSRPQNAIHNLSNFNVYSLASLDTKDYDGFLSKLIIDPVKRFNIVDAITSAPDNIKNVITTPLMLTLLVIVYESEKEIPSTLPDFFEKLFGTVFSRHDRLKAGFDRKHYSGLTETKIQKLFDAFCFMLIQQGEGRTINSTQFKNAFNLAIKYTPDCLCELENFKRDIVDVACLMLDDGFDLVTFLHKSVMEYHAASFIKNSIEDVARKFYSRANQDYLKWGAVLLFLSNIDEIRYGREYIIRGHGELLSGLSNALKSRNEEELIRYLDQALPNFYVNVNGQSFHSISVDANLSNLLTDQLTHTLFINSKSAINSAESLTFYKAIRDSSTKRKGFLSIELKTLFKYFDMSSVWQELALTEASMMALTEKYQEIVKTELNKQDIFN